MTRLPICCAWGEKRLVGTWHRPDELTHPPAERIGLLLLNTGPAPRSGNSDLSARIADHLAGCGLPAFRFDLPGLGDSTGPSWGHIDTYWQAAQQGCNDEALLALIDQLCDSHRLRGLILGGVCAGATAAVRVGATATGRIAGFVLMEPIFRGPSASAAAGRAKTGKRLFSWPGVHRLYAALARSAWLAPLRTLVARVREASRARVLPEDVQKEAVAGWRRTLESGIPSLVILARGLGADRYVMRIERAFPRFPSELLQYALLPDANHLLTSGDAPRLTMEAIAAWVEDCFPAALRAGDKEATPATEIASVPQGALPV